MEIKCLNKSGPSIKITQKLNKELLILKKIFIVVFFILYILDLFYIYAMYNDITDIKNNGLGYTILLFSEFILLCLGILISFLLLLSNKSKVRSLFFGSISIMSTISLMYIRVNFVFIVLVIVIQISLFILFK